MIRIARAATAARGRKRCGSSIKNHVARRAICREDGGVTKPVPGAQEGVGDEDKQDPDQGGQRGMGAPLLGAHRYQERQCGQGPGEEAGNHVAGAVEKCFKKGSGIGDAIDHFALDEDDLEELGFVIGRGGPGYDLSLRTTASPTTSRATRAAVAFASPAPAAADTTGPG